MTGLDEQMFRFVAGETAPTPIEANEGYFIPNELGSLALKRDSLLRGVYPEEDNLELHFRESPAVVFPGAVLPDGIFVPTNYQRRRFEVVVNGVYIGPGSELGIQSSDYITQIVLQVRSTSAKGYYHK